MNYFTTAEQEIPDWLIKTAFLKEVETTVRLGMKSWFCPLSLACDPIWDFLPLFWPCGLCSVVSDSLQPYGLQPARLPCPSNFSGRSTGVGCHFLLQGSSLPRDLTHISCIFLRILYHWAIWEAPKLFLYWSFPQNMVYILYILKIYTQKLCILI